MYLWPRTIAMGGIGWNLKGGNDIGQSLEKNQS